MPSCLSVKDGLDILIAVGMGKSIKAACKNNETVRRAFYEFCSKNDIGIPEKGFILQKVKSPTKKQLSNESLLNEIRKGCYLNASEDSAWGKVTIQVIDFDNKKGGTVTPQEYREFIKDLFGK